MAQCQCGEVIPEDERFCYLCGLKESLRTATELIVGLRKENDDLKAEKKPCPNCGGDMKKVFNCSACSIKTTERCTKAEEENEYLKVRIKELET